MYWVIVKNMLHQLSRTSLNHILCVLRVLCVNITISNVIAFVESGKFPPSLYCHIDALWFIRRLFLMQRGGTVKLLYDILCNLKQIRGLSYKDFKIMKFKPAIWYWYWFVYPTNTCSVQIYMPWTCNELFGFHKAARFPLPRYTHIYR